ncbi:MAG TPA: NERD domain-containing protein [Candidatus Faecalibacterium faecigallinarum]|uniref:NERD domain-containing protein n=2 Tax=Eubacteriales TaxID=186802 RepID=A0A9D2T515_9FIRM|nr:NERD domain-containing protein [Candidatus Faecalibacterium faecigallinarum]
MSAELVFFCFFILIFCLIFAATIYALYDFFVASKSRYKKTDYYDQTHKSFWSMQFDKGSQGEYLIWDSLQQLPGYKKFLFNCYLPKRNGESTEVDLILLHESGIYVFESKNYSGWIFGTETQQYWTQSLPGRYGQAHKVKFFNPILQNQAHLKWLGEYLGIDSHFFYSCIVFGDECTLKDITLTSGRHYVTNRSNLFAAISSHIQLSITKLSPEQIDSLYAKLFPLTQVDAEQRAQHIKEVKEIQHKQEVAAQAPVASAQGSQDGICPLCGGRLVLRTATRGANAGNKFWGCSNFPKCRYIKTISSSHEEKQPPVQ